MIRKLLLIVALSGVASGKMTPPKSFVASAALSVRGGEEPLGAAVKAGSSILDPGMVANVAMGMHLFQGVYSTLAPVKSWEMYGSDVKVSGIHELIIERIGVTLAGLFLTSYWLISKGSSVPAAVGVGALPLVFSFIKSFLNGTPETLGIPQGSELVGAAITGAVAYLGMTDSSHFGNVLKAYGFFNAANGLFFGMKPVDAFNLWGVDITASEAETLQARVCGFWMLSTGVLHLALAQGVDNLKAFGYSWVPVLALSVMINFITKEVDSLEMEKIPHYVWMAVELAVIGTLSL